MTQKCVNAIYIYKKNCANVKSKNFMFNKK